MSQEVRFDKTPLDSVLCKVSFPPIFSISEKAPAEFQSLIMKDYPIASRSNTPFPPPLGPQKLNLPGGYCFVAKDRMWEVSLADSFVSLASRTLTDRETCERCVGYTTWKDFSERLGKVLEALNKTYQIPFYEVTVLRYIDVFQRDKVYKTKLGWGKLITPPFLGMLALNILGVSETGYISTSQVHLKDDLQAQISIKNVVNTNTDKCKEYRERCLMLDSSVLCRTRTNKKDFKVLLNKMHDQSLQIFLNAVTPKMRELMKEVR